MEFNIVTTVLLVVISTYLPAPLVNCTVNADAWFTPNVDPLRYNDINVRSKADK